MGSNEINNELFTDKSRLDWLEKHPRLAQIIINGKAEDCYLYAVSGAPGLKLREIIDTAMRSEISKENIQ